MKTKTGRVVRVAVGEGWWWDVGLWRLKSRILKKENSVSRGKTHTSYHKNV